MDARPRCRFFTLATVVLLALLVGCARTGFEWAPKGPYLAYHKELPAAERAIDGARAAGKDRECPAQFQAAEKLKDDAYKTYWACRTAEAIAAANEAVARAAALCPPTVSLSASPTAIQAGQCATLNWASTNATSTTVEPGVGSVTPSGSRQVCPTSPTTYRITATGAGGTQTASAAVNVTAPPPPPPAAPTVSLSATPDAIRTGQCTTLLWTSTNATGVTLEPGLGMVDTSGSRQVCPTSPTTYRITATGAGGTQTASAAVNVTAPPPPPVAPPPPPPPAPAPPPVVDRLSLRINFDLNKATIRQADVSELQKALAFVKRYPKSKISIEGHTDNTGEASYNQTLSERRAAAVKDYLVKNGVTDGGRIATVGHGESKPVASNATRAGRLQNRRVEILILSD
jgi:outer membrane protein OmpA-like peptidoglycan-associated protein